MRVLVLLGLGMVPLTRVIISSPVFAPPMFPAQWVGGMAHILIVLLRLCRVGKLPSTMTTCMIMFIVMARAVTITIIMEACLILVTVIIVLSIL